MVALAIVATIAPAARSQEAVRLPGVDRMANRQEQIPPGASIATDTPPPPYGSHEQPMLPGGVPQTSPFIGSGTPLVPDVSAPPPTQGAMAMGFGPSSELPWAWQLLPDGLIYRSYLAGIKEPRMGSSWTRDSHARFNDWDVSLGGRAGILRYGTPNAHRPEGFQVDITGVAQTRLDPVSTSTPLIATDYIFGIPITYGVGRWQFKTGYNHLSSHLGDEWMQLHPNVVRINYVRDAIMMGVGYFATDDIRLFGEIDYGVGVGGGAKPIELQTGIDYSPAHPGGAPFAAIYGNMREEVDYGGFFVVQAGWQWRGGLALHTLRIGFEYVNGKSSQYEFFNTFEQRAGAGIWYDF